MSDVKKMAQQAKAASFSIARASEEKKNQILEALVNYLREDQDKILQANREDIAHNNLSAVLIDRLSLQGGRLEGIIDDIKQVIALPDPVGELFDQTLLPNQLKAVKCRTPLGVLGVIYESRPNVTIDVAALSIKSGNCAILRGGSETLNSNRALVGAIQKALAATGLPMEVIQWIASADRAHVKELLQMHAYIDLIIPRGSSSLQQFCKENSSIPVITGGSGVCHLFVDKSADLERSLQVIVNAKTQRPTVCNALDTLLVHADIASAFINKVIETLKGVSFRLDPKAWEYAQGGGCQLAGPEEWHTEWHSLVLGIKVVEDINEALLHIQCHSTGHSDGILTQDKSQAELFVKEIDSAAVYINASTRFTDGGQLGLGAEVAVSTQKFHARGPMGLKELTSFKWIVEGDYHVRK